MAEPGAPFAHLHVHTEYSMLDGAARLKDLFAEVKNQGMTHVAMTDHGNMYGAAEFHRQAQDAGIVGRLDGAPTSELAARAQLALEKQRQEATARERKELRDAGTGDRLVQLANKAVEVIAEPISRAVGESIKTAALRPAVQGQPQPAQGPPPTREQRLAQLQQITHLIGEATAARQKIEADLGETVSIPVPSEPEAARDPGEHAPVAVASASAKPPLPAPVRRPARATKSECDPPYTIDGAGHKRYIPKCF